MKQNEESEELMRLLKGYYDEELIELKNKLKQAEDAHRARNSTKAATFFSKYKKIWLPAIAALLIVVAGIFYFRESNEDIAQLAKESSFAGHNRQWNTKADSIAVVELLIRSGQFREYISKATELRKQTTDISELGILNINICKSYIQLDEAEQAIAFYQSLSSQEKDFCYLQYQLALANVITKNNSEANRLFDEVIKKGCFPVDEKAKEWIKKIK